MASVTPPNPTYRPRLPLEVVTEGRLSRIQMERVIYAGQRHEQRLPDGARGGFYVGDGTGVGKGRVLAAIIVDNWFQNRRRALWLSVNNDLVDSAKRDLDDLGVRIPLAKINDYPAAEAITLPYGVIFSSYSSLIPEAKTGQRRLDQIQKWLGTDPVVILDEAHKAKNALAGGHLGHTRAARREIVKSPLMKECMYWLDIGNNADSGQFVLGQPKNGRNRRLKHRLPVVSELFPEIATPDLAASDDLPSCSAVEALERQEPFINQTLAYQALALLARLFRHGQLTHHGAFLDIRNGRMTSLAVNPEVWRRMIAKRAA